MVVKLTVHETMFWLLLVVFGSARFTSRSFACAMKLALGTVDGHLGTSPDVSSVQAVGSGKPVDVGSSAVAPYENMARLLLFMLDVH
jgi:hypothetical protein